MKFVRSSSQQVACRRTAVPAFTLLESLVAVAVIGVVVALLMPAISGLRAKATATKAAGNLRQLAAAQLTYAGENNQSFTPAWSPANPVSWQIKLLPYLYPNASNGSTLRSDPKSVFNVPDAKLGAGGLTSIGLNTYMASTNPVRYWNFRANLVPRPASIILLGEIEVRNNDFVQPPDQNLGASKPGFRRDRNTRALMAFCDGHVEAMSTNALISTQPSSSNPWFWW